MKKLILLVGALAITFASCSDKKKEEVKKEIETVKEEVKVEEPAATVATGDDKVAAGEKLFTAKTCNACHAKDSKVVGPSIKDIAAKYAETGGNMVKFLKGNADAIVDTDPGQVAVMKNNIDTILKDITPDELQAITAYMRSVK